MKGSDMQILITGSDGFIGRNLIVELQNKGFKKLLLCNRETTLERLKNYTDECDVVFHLAGINRPKEEEEYHRGNVEFTRILVDLLKDNPKSPMVLFSSSVQAGEDNAYGKSKRQAEQILKEYAHERNALVIIYRLPNVFGKWCRPDYNSVVATFCYHITHNEDIKIDRKEASITLAYIDDLLHTIIGQLVSSRASGVFYQAIPELYHLTVGELADIIKKFKDFRNNLEIPNLSNILEKKLYATYLSYLPENEFKYPLKMNLDQRGSFTEFLRSKEKGQISINVTKPGITKGNHWHHTKVEKFLVVKGKALIRLRHMITGKMIECSVSEVDLEVVDIPVGYTHNITNVGQEDLVTVMWSNEMFDSENPDTYYEEV
ncbi:NAD-dependent epimerase/dehydratase family protein [Lacrimispora celerecrescens]|uniref:polysaccharide biosynthesis C-terminal domain-containing protein n=1 Tax=Lacrimispora celerecrescens TaxID=29354 RepID=UPI002452B0C1|nr:NAD-dependent epimerase/dehydratase family protein [Lacrimispora celerecrescens]